MKNAHAKNPDINDVLGEAHTTIHRAKSLTELLYMAGESMSDRTVKNAITTGCDLVDKLLQEAADQIEIASQQARSRP